MKQTTHKTSLGIGKIGSKFLMLSIAVFAYFSVNAQFSVTTNGGSGLAGTYTSLANAITALNAATINSPVVITCPTGTETSPSGGFSITAIGSATNTITIQGNGAANSVITAPSPAGTAGNLNDAIFKLVGADYVTIQGFKMQENASNTTTTVASNNMLEFGVALLYASTTNGAQNNTIQNNTITLNRTYVNTFGIYSNTRHAANAILNATTVTADATSSAGTNSNNKIYSNVINNVNFGVVFIGGGTSTVIDLGNDVGGSSLSTANTITNWGNGGATASTFTSLTANNWCIIHFGQANNNISYNTITSASLTSSVTVGGVLTNYLSTAQPTGTITTTINNNTIQITNNPGATTTGSIQGIAPQGLTPLLSTATISVNNNTVQNCVLGGSTSTTNGISGVINFSLPGTLNITGNNILNNSITATTATSGGFTAISNSGAAGTININSNVVRGYTNNTNTSYSGSFLGISNSGAVVTAININNNQIGNASGNAVTYSLGASSSINNGIQNSAGASTCALNINNNNFQGFTFVTASSVAAIINTSGFVGGNISMNADTLGTASVGFVSFSSATSASVFGFSNAGGSSTTALTMTNNIIRGITHTTQGSSAHTYFSNTFATLSQNISTNKFVNLNVNTTGSVTFVANAVTVPATGNMNINNDSIITAFNKGGAGGTVTFYSSNGSSATGSVINFQNNYLSNITLTGATGFIGINNTDGGSPTKTITGNTINSVSGGTGSINPMTINFMGATSSVSSNTITNITWATAITALSIGSSSAASTTLNLNSNVINNIVSTAGAVTGISVSAPATTTTLNVSSNLINTLSSNSSGAITGISFAALSTTANVFKNKIYDLSGSNASTTVAGITVSTSGTTLNLFNNLIGDLRATAATVTSPASAIIGINITSTTTSTSLNVYYNTVNIAASSTGTNFATAGILHTISTTATTAALNLRNNVIVNTSTAAGTGLTIAYRRSGGAANNLNNYVSASNNNLFYAGSPSASNLIYSDGTSTAQTLTAYKGGVFTAGTIASRDAASISENPTWQSTSGSSANFLKFSTSVATGIESGAANISTFTDDYTGTVRFGNSGSASTGTAPDMGAWELNGIPLPLCTNTPASSTISAISSAICTGSGTTLSLSSSYTDIGISFQWKSSTTTGGPYSTSLGTSSTQATGNLSATTYYICVITCANSGLSYTTAEKIITVNALPTVGVSPSSATFCSPAGTAVALNGTGASTYSWSPSSGLSATTGASVTASPTSTTTYTLTGTDANGCVNTATTTITAANSVFASATATPATVCSGANSQLLATAAQSFTTPTPSAYSLAGSTTTYTAITGTTLTTSTTDDNGVGNLPIGFTFNYNGTNHTVFGMRTNGLIELSQSTAALSGFSSNALASNANCIAPLWDDNNMVGGTMIFTTTGSVGSRVLTAQWTAMHVGGSGAPANPTIDMQVKLYETSNKIEFIYGATSATLTSTTASIGLSGAVGNFLSLTPLNPANTSTKSSSTENASISTATNFPSGTIYTFAPTGAPTLTYAWSPATFLSSTTISNPVATALTGATNYTVTITGVGGCQTTASASVAVSSGAAITADPANSAKCTGQTATFTVTATGPSLTYQWRKGGTNITGNASATTATLTLTNISATDAATYDVVVSATCGSPITSAGATLTVTTALAGINASATVICTGSGNSVTLTENGGNATSWSWSNGATTQAITVSPSSSTTYTVTATVNGCSATASQLVSVNPTPAAVSVTPSSATICPGASQLLVASGGTVPTTINGTLGTASTLTGATTQPTAFCNRWAQYWNQTIYTAAELTAAGLSAGSVISSITYTTTTQGDANNNTNFSISIGNTASTTLSAFQTTGLTTVFGPTSYTHAVGANLIPFTTNFTWDGASNIIIDVRQDGADITNNAITTFTAAADNKNIEAHTSTTSATTTLQSLVSTASVTPTASTSRLNIVLAYSSTISPTWSWSPSGTLNTASGATVTATPASTTTYTATATINGCSSNNTATVTVSSGGVAITTQPIDTSKCAGQTARFTVAATGPSLTYQWRKGGTNITGNASATTATLTLTNISATDVATYDVVVSATCGSPVTSAGATLTVTTPLAGINASSTVICIGSGNSVTLTENGGNATSWSWSNGATTQAITVTPSSATTYTVTATVNGCTATASQLVSVNPTPAAVSVTPSSATVCPGGSQILVASGGAVTNAGNAILGTASTLTGATTQPTAFCNRWAQYWNQTIYTAAELTAAGLSAGSVISSLTYTTTTQGDANDNTNFSIRIGNTASATLSAFQTTGLTTVFGPTTYTHSVGDNLIPFTTNFTWDGTSNIIIDVRQDGVDGTNNALTTFTAASTNKNIEAHTSTTSATTTLQSLVASASVTPTASTSRLNIVLAYSSVANPTWSWSPSGTLNTASGATVTATPISTTTYIATATVNGCTSNNTATVTVSSGGAIINTQPIDTSKCAGQTARFTVAATGPSLAYQWYSNSSPITGNASATTATLTLTNVSAADQGVYVVEVSSTCGDPVFSDAALLTVTTPLAGINASATIICTGTGNSVTLTENGGNATSWSWSNGATTKAITVAPSSSTTYTVTATVNGCSATSSQLVSVNTTPAAVTITPSSASICSGGTQALVASGGAVVNAGNATLGTASTLTGATTQPTAFCNRWSQYWNQTIYTAAELTAAGLSAGSVISSVTYTTTTQGDANNNTNFSIRIGNTANATLSAFQTTGLTTVFGPTTYTHAVGANLIPFTTNFTWDGTSNIIIDVRQDGADAANNAITTFTAAADNKNIEAHTSTTSATTALQSLVASASVTPTASTTRLNIILAYSSVSNPTWSWSPSGTLNTTSGATVTASPTSTTTYTATSTVNGCSSNNTVTVSISTGAAITTEPSASSKCAGQTATFTVAATGQALMYQWRKGGTNINTTTNPSAGTATLTLTNVSAADVATYDVVVTAACGSPVTSAGAALTIHTPVAGIGSSATTVCSATNSVTLTENGGNANTWSWSNGATTQAITVTPSTTTTYTVTATLNGCIATASQTITVNPMPSVVTITPSASSICPGASNALVASGGTLTNAGNATLGTAATLTGATAQPTAFCNRWSQYWNQTIYTAAELTAAGLSAGSVISSVTYTTTTQGDANNNTNFSIRIGNTASTTLSAFQTTGLTTVFGPATYTHTVGANLIPFTTNYTWDGTSNIIIDVRQDGADATNNAITTFTAATTNKNIEAHTSTTSATTTLQSLVASATVTPTASTTRLNIVLGYSLVTNPTWSWSPSGTLNTASGASVTATPTITTTYTATATINGCSTSNTATVTLKQPTSSTVNVSICPGGSYVFNGTTYTTAGTRTSIFTNAVGCDSTVTLNLTITSPTTPSVTITNTTNNTDTVCSGNNVTFTANGTNGGPNPVYTWYKNSTSVGTGSSITFTAYTLSTGDEISCVLTANNACQATATATSNTHTMYVNASPAIGVSTGFTICKLDTTVYGIYNTNTQGGGVWTSSNTGIATVTTASNGGTGLVSAVANGTAILTYTKTASNGCILTASAPVIVAVATPPNAITGTNIICKGNTTQLASTTTGGVWATTTPGYATINSTGLVNGVSAGNAVIKYTKTNANGCSANVSYTVTINALPLTPTIGYQVGTTDPQRGAGGAFCANKTFTVVGSPSSPGSGIWSKSGVISVSTTSNGVASISTGSVAGAGSLTYTYTNVNGCSSSRTIAGNVVTCASRGVNGAGNEKLNASEFTMYPNPAKTFISLNVETLIGTGNIVVTDLYGKQVKTQPLSLGTNTIDVSLFAKGMYLVSVITSEGKTTKKLVVE